MYYIYNTYKLNILFSSNIIYSLCRNNVNSREFCQSFLFTDAFVRSHGLYERITVFIRKTYIYIFCGFSLLRLICVCSLIALNVLSSRERNSCVHRHAYWQPFQIYNVKKLYASSKTTFSRRHEFVNPRISWQTTYLIYIWFERRYENSSLRWSHFELIHKLNFHNFLL